VRTSFVNDPLKVQKCHSAKLENRSDSPHLTVIVVQEDKKLKFWIKLSLDFLRFSSLSDLFKLNPMNSLQMSFKVRSSTQNCPTKRAAGFASVHLPML